MSDVDIMEAVEPVQEAPEEPVEALPTMPPEILKFFLEVEIQKGLDTAVRGYYSLNKEAYAVEATDAIAKAFVYYLGSIRDGMTMLSNFGDAFNRHQMTFLEKVRKGDKTMTDTIH